jgi:hypothetical protein
MTFEALAKSFDRYNVAKKAAERFEEGEASPSGKPKCTRDAHARKVKHLGLQLHVALDSYVKARTAPLKRRSGPTMESLVNQLVFRLALALGVPTRNILAENRHQKDSRDRHIKDAGETLHNLIVQAVAKDIDSGGQLATLLANVRPADRTIREGREAGAEPAEIVITQTPKKAKARR